jgi:hypothetical protein
VGDAGGGDSGVKKGRFDDSVENAESCNSSEL